MFAYYGSKRGLAACYPEPQHDLIVEAFAGSAGYSLYGDRWRRRVLLFELDDDVADAWRWLIEDATPAAVRAIGTPAVGTPVAGLPALVRVTTRAADGRLAAARGDGRSAALGTVTPETALRWERSRAAIAADVAKVKHWEVRQASCFEAPEVEATWFVDPPYQGPVGQGYAHGSESVDFRELARWIGTRRGQVIACEGGGANYLPFAPLRPGIDRRGDPHAELVWCRPPAAGESTPPSAADGSSR